MEDQIKQITRLLSEFSEHPLDKVTIEPYLEKAWEAFDQRFSHEYKCNNCPPDGPLHIDNYYSSEGGPSILVEPNKDAQEHVEIDAAIAAWKLLDNEYTGYATVYETFFARCQECKTPLECVPRRY